MKEANNKETADERFQRMEKASDNREKLIEDHSHGRYPTGQKVPDAVDQAQIRNEILKDPAKYDPHFQVGTGIEKVEPKNPRAKEVNEDYEKQKAENAKKGPKAQSKK